MICTYIGMANCFFCVRFHPWTLAKASMWSTLHQWGIEAPKKDELKWWKPMRHPSIQVKRKMMICHLFWSPTMDKMSSNLWRAPSLFKDPMLNSGVSLWSYIISKVATWKGVVIRRVSLEEYFKCIAATFRSCLSPLRLGLSVVVKYSFTSPTLPLWPLYHIKPSGL